MDNKDLIKKLIVKREAINKELKEIEGRVSVLKVQKEFVDDFFCAERKEEKTLTLKAPRGKVKKNVIKILKNQIEPISLEDLTKLVIKENTWEIIPQRPKLAVQYVLENSLKNKLEKRFISEETEYFIKD